MAIPNKATGGGNTSTARNVFRCAFSTALSAPVIYYAYDGATYPATGSAVTTSNTIFAGTAGNSNKPMLSLVDTTNAAPASSWKPASATAGTANPNRMKGTTNYVTQEGANVGAGGTITWNECLELPSDATTGSTMAYDLVLSYQYTGSAPSLTWTFNEGTEGTPSWTTLTPGTHGVRHCNSGTTAGTYALNIPTSGTVDGAELWVTT